MKEAVNVTGGDYEQPLRGGESKLTTCLRATEEYAWMMDFVAWSS